MLVWATIFFIRVGAMCADDIDVTRNDETEDLLACPQWTGF